MWKRRYGGAFDGNREYGEIVVRSNGDLITFVSMVRNSNLASFKVAVYPVRNSLYLSRYETVYKIHVTESLHVLYTFVLRNCMCNWTFAITITIPRRPPG